MTRGLVQAHCPSCGQIETPAAAVICGISESHEHALCELPCPRCGRLLLRPLPPTEVSTLLLFGARRAGRPLPFELAEPHRGAAVTWDEVLNLHMELEGDCCPHERLLRP